MEQSKLSAGKFNIPIPLNSVSTACETVEFEKNLAWREGAFHVQATAGLLGSGTVPVSGDRVRKVWDFALALAEPNL